VVIPADLSPGTWYLLAVADFDAVVEETSETNNTRSRSIKLGADLSMSTLTAPSTAAVGESVTVTYTTRNLGGDDAPESVAQFFLSSNGALDGADLPLGQRDVAALAAGATSSASVELDVPPDTDPGRWYLIGQADSLDDVPEALESNNLRVRSITIAVQ
jgi:subtilase family serine protease